MTSAQAAADLLDGSIAEAASRLRLGLTSAEALTEAALRRAEALQPKHRAFVEVRRESALEQARERDREAAAGRWRGPLHGIPLAHKDCFERIGWPMTVGSKVIDAAPRSRTATALQRLDEAGAVDLGALNLSELVAGPTGQNPHTGDARNAWDPERISGGSSSGSGVAVAGGAVFGSLGSDTGGSIRLPASVNGLFGMKPTYGRVSRDGCFPRAFSLDCVGPLARSAEDCALLLYAVAGADARDPSSLPAPVPDYVAGLSRAAARSRIAVLETGVACEPAIVEALERVVATLAKQFAPPPRVRFAELDLCYALGDTISKVEAATLHGDAMRDRPGDFSQAVYSRTEPGLHLPAVRYVEALNLRGRLLQAFLAGPLGEADVLVCPTLPVAVPLATDADMERPGRVFDVVPRLTALTRPFNYLGVPVLSMPVGLDGASMPIGMQLVGRPFGEARLLAVAHLLAAALDWPAMARSRARASS